jgi:predicted HTH transcriptional regulator
VGEMKSISEEDFLAIIEIGYETPNLEFKPSFTWNDKENKWFREKIIQTVLAMSNTRDGGTIVVGIEEKDNQLIYDGISDKELKTFNYDSLKDVMDGFASPLASFDLAQAKTDNKIYLIINVSEFDEQPIICKNDGDNIGLLRRGDVYVRSKRGNPGSIKVTEIEMKEIIELAVDKHQAKLKKRGWQFEGAQQVDETYKKERGGF